jgi:tRNA(Ile)-lysidine synthase
MPETHAPIQPDELDGLFARFASLGPCALAVSGGSDSTALMVLYADWLRQRRASIKHCTVLTVDHGLRPSSADEARAVAATAAELGYRHATLPWEGQKPRAGIQAAARAARYRLMGDYMRTHGINLLLTGHTRDDQAETLLMRLARGSGLDGLSAMAPLAPLGDYGAPGADAEDGGLWIGRPFLDVPKLTLRATLEARRMRWMEDPSNIAPEFERARLRAARIQLDALGLTPDMLALSAARLARARRAVEAMVDEVCDPEAGMVQVDQACGAVLIHRRVLRQTAEEVALRVLERAILAAGGGERPSLGKLEAVVRALWEARDGRRGSQDQSRWTLARALITAEPDVVRVERELGREPLPELTLAPGAAALWDGRFWVSAGTAYAGGPLAVRALGEAALRELRRRRLVAEGPARGAATVPALWRGDEMIAAPSLGFWSSAHAHDQLDAVFAGLGTPPNVAGAQTSHGGGHRRSQPAGHRAGSAPKRRILS